MKSYLVYEICFDSDFDTCPQVYFLGLYKEKSKAYEICTKDICKNTFCKGIDTNKEYFMQLL